MKLERIRKRIDEIDCELLTLLEERMELGLRTRKHKKNIEDGDREAAVLEGVRESPRHLIDPAFAEKVFGTIMKESKRLQKAGRPLVAFQGEHGAYGEVAVRSLVPEGVAIPCMEFADVFRGVEQEEFDYGVVPVENSLEGAVTQVNELLAETELKVVGEAGVPVHHSLLACQETDYREIRVVYSHPQALGQCHGFLSRNKLETRPFYDTAGAAKMLASQKPRAAAVIASNLAAKLYGLETIKTEIEDDHSNSTRFLLLSREGLAEGGDKCSIVFATAHVAGRLLGALQLFAEAEINLTRIASMPRRVDPGNYAFFLDFEGSDKEANVAEVLDAMRERTSYLRFLGCYPRAQVKTEGES
jgi:prephenate dehydratase